MAFKIAAVAIAVNTVSSAILFVMQDIHEFMENVLFRLVAGDLLLTLIMCIIKLLYYWLDDVKKAAIHRIIASMGDTLEKK